MCFVPRFEIRLGNKGFLFPNEGGGLLLIFTLISHEKAYALQTLSILPMVTSDV